MDKQVMTKHLQDRLEEMEGHFEHMASDADNWDYGCVQGAINELKAILKKVRKM